MWVAEKKGEEDSWNAIAAFVRRREKRRQGRKGGGPSSKL